MNQALLQRRATELKALLEKYASGVPDATKLYSALRGISENSLQGDLVIPLEWREVPGDSLFSEGTLNDLVDLSNAYYKFKVEATGGPSPVLQNFRLKHGFDLLPANSTG